MQWNAEQAEVIRQMQEGRGHLLVSARAGAGKTTTVTHGVGGMHGHILMCAFNRSTRDALQRKLGRDDVTIRTTHQLGFRLCGHHWRSKTVGDDPDAKGRRIAKRVAAEHGAKGIDYWAHRAASLAKNLGLRKRTKLLPIVEASGATFTLDFRPPDLEKIVWGCLKAAKADTAHVDFDDMIWLPFIHRADPATRFGTVIVDELQDLNAPQTWLVDTYTAPTQYGGRIIGVGDERQAIYQFRGAEGAFDWLRLREPQELLMPVTYRCAQAIVEYAQDLVPDIAAAPDAPEGEVHQLGMADLAPYPGDVVLSRTNAPLMAAGMRLVRQGTPIQIKGKDFETKLRSLAERGMRNGVKTPGEMEVFTNEWVEEQRIILSSEDALGARVDQADALVAIAKMCESVDGILRSIRSLFERPRGNHVTLSTVHRFKGLEADRVWLIEPSFMNPDTFDSPDHPEANVRYVAITRAKTELFLLGKMRRPEREHRWEA